VGLKQLALEQSGSIEMLLHATIEKFSRFAGDLENTEDDGTPYFDSACEALAIAREPIRLREFERFPPIAGIAMFQPLVPLFDVAFPVQQTDQWILDTLRRFVRRTGNPTAGLLSLCNV
jgi:hypothetical protein